MNSTMDIAVCLDCSSSILMSNNWNTIHSGLFSMLVKAKECDPNSTHMALIKFKSHMDNLYPNSPRFTSSMDEYREWFDTVQSSEVNPNQCKAIGDAISASLQLNWRHNTNGDRYHEKLVILITDGPPCMLSDNNCALETGDLWRMSDELAKQDITLVVIGIETYIVACDDFYCALANNTGGEYLPIKNAFPILTNAITKVLTDADTLQQLLRNSEIRIKAQHKAQYHYGYGHKRVRGMIKTCNTMADVQRKYFPYRSNAIEIPTHNFNDDHAEFLSSSSFREDYYGSFCRDINSIASTPTTDDEGYRTRLPTTASSDTEIYDSSDSSSSSDPDELVNMDDEWS